MCGLVGLAGNITLKEEKTFKRLLELDTTRGPHSTGIFAVKSDKSTILAKSIGTPWDLYETKACEKIFHSVVKVLIGHNRWATKGKINKTNAHPFEFEHVAGAHNGTLNTTYQLDDSHMFDVDSENLYYHMNANGVEDTIKNLNGAYALTWYDKRTHTMNLIRNNERPLFYTFTEDMKTLLWASEDWMITIAAAQAGLKHKEIQLLPIGVLHSFEVPEFGKEFEKTRVRKMEMYEAPKRVITNTTTHGNTFPKDNKVVAITGKVKRPFSEYHKYVGKSCVFSVASEGVSSTGQHFIQCWSVDDDDISIRVFATKDGYLWKQLMNSSNYFRALAKSYSSLENGYLTTDLRTVEEIIDMSDDVPEEMFLGEGGELITEDEFDDRTKKGCSWCSHHVTTVQHEYITWISKNEFICPNCSDQPEVKAYLAI